MRETMIGRALAAALLAGALALAWLQSRSPLARALSEGRPILGWLRIDGRTPALFLTVYQPVRRTMDILYLPAAPRAQAGLSVAAAAAQLAPLAPTAGICASLPVWRGTLPAESEEPPLDAADWTARSARKPRTWLQPLLPPGAAAWSLFDRLLLALEFQRLGPADLRPAWLPPDDQAGGLINHLILGSGGPPVQDRITVEVLNASAEPGIASRAKNILRLKGADVMSVGNVATQGRTIVYDRTGRFEAAAAVARMLGCPAARPLTQVDLKRLVDVSVVLAGDCQLPQGG
jgi:hypothetical protein